MATSLKLNAMFGTNKKDIFYEIHLKNLQLFQFGGIKVLLEIYRTQGMKILLERW